MLYFGSLSDKNLRFSSIGLRFESPVGRHFFFFLISQLGGTLHGPEYALKVGLLGMSTWWDRDLLCSNKLEMRINLSFHIFLKTKNLPLFLQGLNSILFIWTGEIQILHDGAALGPKIYINQGPKK